MSNLKTEHEIEIDQIHDRQLAEKDAEIEKLKIEALSEKNSHYRSLQLWGEKEDRLKALITELCDALQGRFFQRMIIPAINETSQLIHRAREATR